MADSLEDDLYTMPFGKYQGHYLDRIPTTYLEWLVTAGQEDDSHIPVRCVNLALRQLRGRDDSDKYGCGLERRR